MHSDGGYKGSGSGSGGRVNQLPLTKRGMENNQTGSGAQSQAYQSSKVWTETCFYKHSLEYVRPNDASTFLLQGAATNRPEEELDRLTKKLVYDMNHPPAEDYFGIVTANGTLLTC